MFSGAGCPMPKFELSERDIKLRMAAEAIIDVLSPRHYAPVSPFWQTVRAEKVNEILDTLVKEGNQRVLPIGG